MAGYEIGMCFNDDMVRAILDGSKTQTRRPLRVQPPEWASVVLHCWHGGSFGWTEPEQDDQRILRQWPVDKSGEYCAMPAPGDPNHTRIWVREAYRVQEFSFAPDLWCRVQYRADGSERVIKGAKGAMYVNAKNPRAWKPSIHMPRAFCRQELLITSNSPERVQEISEKDAILEGIKPIDHANGEPVFRNNFEDGYYAYSAVESFKTQWDNIYGFSSAKAWNNNPWVWAIEFCKVDQKAQA